MSAQTVGVSKMRTGADEVWGGIIENCGHPLHGYSHIVILLFLSTLTIGETILFVKSNRSSNKPSKNDPRL